MTLSRMTTLLLVCAFVSTMATAQKIGIEPKAKPAEYSIAKEDETLTLAATRLSPKEVRKTFVSNVGKKYVVVEIGVFPKSSTELDPQQFVLRQKPSGAELAAADPKKMAVAINADNQKGQDIAVYPTAGVEYSTGSSPDDPYYDPSGNRRYGQHGITYSKGVMVEVNSKKKDPHTSHRDEQAMVAELSEKSLPPAATTKAVAGYLYFETSVDPQVNYELEYRGTTPAIILPLPSPSK
jgi:hypothetical protein